MSMYNFLEYISKYFEDEFKDKSNIFKDESSTFNADTGYNNNYNSFDYEANSLRSIFAPNQADGIFNNETFVFPLKYPHKFWRSFEMPLINWKVELKIKRENIVF